jgi:hypothetical protein
MDVYAAYRNKTMRIALSWKLSRPTVRIGQKAVQVEREPNLAHCEVGAGIHSGAG